MAMKEPRIVVWCGAAANQKALVNKLAKEFNVVGIVVDTFSRKKSKRTFVNWIGLIVDRFRFKKIYGAWSSLISFYNDQFPEWPNIPMIRVPTINDTQTKLKTEEWKPDLIVVSGTALIKQHVIDIPVSIGILNLHTGLSPYVKGGPNCTNWCIANNDFHLVGNTIMWLNAGIDTGNILTTSTVDITLAKDLNEAHRLVMDKAHALYMDAIRYVSTAHPPFRSIPQASIEKGKLYMTKMWTAEKRKQLLTNWKKRKDHKPPFVPTTVSLVN
jgi:hypothetical protein